MRKRVTGKNRGKREKHRKTRKTRENMGKNWKT